MNHAEPTRGRCLCRAVAYEITAPAVSAAHCHCESCRRAHSAPVVTWLTLAATQWAVFKGQEALTRYESSPGAFRLFCQHCGSQLFMKYNAEPDCVYVAIASLESTPDLLPDRHFSFEERVPWFSFRDSLPRYFGKTKRVIDEN